MNSVGVDHERDRQTDRQTEQPLATACSKSVGRALKHRCQRTLQIKVESLLFCTKSSQVVLFISRPLQVEQGIRNLKQIFEQR